MSESRCTNFPYLDANEFARACESFLLILHKSHVTSKLIRSDGEIKGIEITLIRCLENKEVVLIKAHLVLSPVYSLPTLYFTATLSTAAGQDRPITLVEDVFKYVIVDPLQSASLQVSSVYGHAAISQGEHPLYNRLLSFYVHPCRTGEVMSVIDQDSKVTIETYMTIWGGLVGPVIGLAINGDSIINS
ncbi:hypothetical protein V1514DRAFT_331508 [Lipomyces japonicus]|uniref:uncharacterized protein n=1 Tax=Lipomyces japonicus TaxID=56871 RepID=UPI0034CDF052